VKYHAHKGPKGNKKAEKLTKNIEHYDAHCAKGRAKFYYLLNCEYALHQGNDKRKNTSKKEKVIKILPKVIPKENIHNFFNIPLNRLKFYIYKYPLSKINDKIEG